MISNRRSEARRIRRWALWQVDPSVLGERLGDPDPAKARRVMEAMLGMKKIDIAGLKRAYAAASTGPLGGGQ